MTDYKELCASLREEAEAVQAIEWGIPICTDNHIREAADVIERQSAEIERLNRAADFIRELANGERAANDRLQKRLRAADAECAEVRRENERLTAENRAKETYIAEHMGGTAERNAQMRRDAERLRGTGKNK